MRLPTEQESSPRAIRRAARKPLIWTAVQAGVSEPTARVYELDPLAVRDERKRAALDVVYAELARRVVNDGSSAV